MILSVDPLVTGAIVTISYILSNFTPTDPIRFATLYDDGIAVQAQYYSEDPPITQANLWEYTTLPNGMSTLRNQETGRLLSLNISDILDSFWNVHLYTGDLSKVPGNLNTTEGCCQCYDIDLPTQTSISTAIGPSSTSLIPFPNRITLDVDPNGYLAATQYNNSSRPRPGLWFLRQRRTP